MIFQELLYILAAQPDSNNMEITDSSVIQQLNEIRKVLSLRQDMTLAVYKALEMLLIDYAIILSVAFPSTLTDEVISLFISFWKPSSGNCYFPKSIYLYRLFSSRTVKLICEVRHQADAWDALTKLVTELLTPGLVSPASLQDQCISLLQEEWPEEIHSGLSSCIKGFAQNLKDHPELGNDQTIQELLSWVGWVFDQMQVTDDFDFDY